jgi:Cu(I)/Ag(I) efflux system membrane protein CusA/SilA
LPDLSDVQVIIRTSYPGQAPQIVENQVTYPLATTMLAVPGATTVRGYSFFGDSFVYVLFEDGTDLYWARSRVLEYLNQVQGRCRPAPRTSLGPDATGVGWIFQYALVDRSGRNDLAQLRALQDWFLKYELKSLEGVAEVATVGGMVKQYQVVVDPHKLAAYGLTFEMVRMALMAANQETGGSVLELAEAEYMVRASGYLKTLDDFRAVPLMVMGGVPDAPGRRGRGADRPRDAPWHCRAGRAGRGDRRRGDPALRAPTRSAASPRVKARLEALKPSLPPGVEVVVTYDRSELIERAVNNLSHQAAGGVHRRGPGLRGLPVAPAQFAGGHHQPAAGHPGGLRGDALAGHQRQHHVAGRHRHRHRRDGRCGHRDDRKRAQEDRGLATRQPRPRAARRRTLARGDRSGGGSRARRCSSAC